MSKRDLRSEQVAFNTDHDSFDLFRAAALIARVESPELNIEAVSRQVGELAGEVRRRIDDKSDISWPAPLIALGEILFDEYGFRGDSEAYDDPQNSFMHRVLERRQGLPIALSVLTVEVARRSGLEAYGIGFPGHFLVGIAHDGVSGERDLVVLDAFAGGRLLTSDHLHQRLKATLGPTAQLSADHLAPAPPEAILERMLLNLRRSYLARNDWTHVEAVLSRLLLLRPGHHALLLDRARARRLLLDFEGALEDAHAAAPQHPQAARLVEELTRESTVMH
jgi:regulator of sirC expression with transglutaminase-like and TPR domain